MVQLFLVLHVLGAIFVFGPTLAFTFLASETRRMPGHGAFAAAVGDAIERKVVLPGAVVQGITGLGLILVLGVDLTTPEWRWLILAIVLYAISVTFAFAVQAPNSAKMLEFAKTPPPAGVTPAGPPPAVVALGGKLARGGQFLTVMIVAIVILMVTKPRG
jgi:uncharacterized membrane protein